MVGGVCCHTTHLLAGHLEVCVACRVCTGQQHGNAPSFGLANDDIRWIVDRRFGCCKQTHQVSAASASASTPFFSTLNINARRSRSSIVRRPSTSACSSCARVVGSPSSSPATALATACLPPPPPAPRRPASSRRPDPAVSAPLRRAAPRLLGRVVATAAPWLRVPPACLPSPL